MKAQLILDWFEDEIPCDLTSLNNALSTLLARGSWDFAVTDIHCLEKIRWQQDGQPADWPCFWHSLSPSLARQIDILLGDGLTSVIVLSSDGMPPELLGRKSKSMSISKTTSPSAGLWWLPITDILSNEVCYCDPDAAREALADYWRTRLSSAWSKFGHGEIRDLVNEGLGCIRALAMEVHNGKEDVADKAWKQLIGTIPPSPQNMKVTERWLGCIQDLIKGLEYDAAVLRIASPGLKCLLEQVIERVTPPEGMGNKARLWRLPKIFDDIRSLPEKTIAYNACGELAESIWDLFLISTAVSLRRPGEDRRIGTVATMRTIAVPGHVGNLLIVDDTPEPWIPLFELLADLLHVNIDFSVDGVTIASRNSVDLSSRLHWYDAVLMDVKFPGQETDGLNLAHSIKLRHPTLPVIVWSSSDSPDVLSNLKLVDDYVLKKSVTLTADQKTALEPKFRHAIARRQNRRRIQLLDPGFHEAITVPSLRHLAQSAAEKAMDSFDAFHALDDSYFRFFNDHGTKHSIRVAENLRRLFESLFPLVHQTGISGNEMEVDALLNGCVLTERSLALLYAAAFVHEIGMFYTDITDISRPTQGAHSIRLTAADMERRLKDYPLWTMVWLADYRDDFRTVDLVERDNFLRDLAVICVARWRQVTDKETFDKACNSFPRASDAVASLNMEELESNPEKMHDLIILGKMLALADVLDCDCRRVPPDFIRDDPRVQPRQYGDWMKHLAVARCEISQGEVTVYLNNKSAPTNDHESHDIIARYYKEVKECLNR